MEKFNKIPPMIIIYSVAIKLDSRVPNGRKMKVDKCLKDAIR
ncbi:MAG: hypothetical protein ACFE9V_02020 [Candidatus Hodarchaeota archaeon]